MPKERRMRILLVGMPDSVHVARWIEANLANQFEILVFASSPLRKTNPKLKYYMSTSHDKNLIVRRHRLSFIAAIPLWILDRPPFFAGKVRGFLIGRAIASFEPHIVHVMESQNGGYPTRYAMENFGSRPRPKVLLTLFGSDLFWFSGQPSHRTALRELLRRVDFLQPECERDSSLARELGFGGVVLPELPVAGGLNSSLVLPVNDVRGVGHRKTIAVKGYGGTWGLAKEALLGLRNIADQLAGFKIEIFSASRIVRRFAVNLFENTNVTVITHPKFALSHAEMLTLFRRSIAYLGFSRSDGLPASMLEAMSQGAFPVQTDSACINGWFTNGISGLKVETINTRNFEADLGKFLGDGDFLESAADENRKTILDKYSDATISHRAARLYLEILSKP